MSITATLNSGTTIQGSISEGKTAAVTRVTIQGPKGDT